MQNLFKSIKPFKRRLDKISVTCYAIYITFELAQEITSKDSNKGTKTKGRKTKSEDPEWLKNYVNKFEDGVDDL